MFPKEFSVKDKVAIVTGGGRGIGRAISLTLAKAGADITMIARTKEQVEQTASEVRQLGRKTLAISMDVTDKIQVKKAVKYTLTKLGKIDIMINNAGIDSPMKPIAYITGVKFPSWELTQGNWNKQLELDEWQRIIDVNLTAPFLFAQAVGPHFLRQKRGKFINVSSNSAELGSPYCAPYCVSKAGSVVLPDAWHQNGLLLILM
jgi:NAD(P)-dependent dehydrogenase (short-subunit alcohol dehydrogenase family)